MVTKGKFNHTVEANIHIYLIQHRIHVVNISFRENTTLILFARALSKKLPIAQQQITSIQFSSVQLVFIIEL